MNLPGPLSSSGLMNSLEFESRQSSTQRQVCEVPSRYPIYLYYMVGTSRHDLTFDR